jgi:hypothetical protein
MAYSQGAVEHFALRRCPITAVAAARSPQRKVGPALDVGASRSQRGECPTGRLGRRL